MPALAPALAPPARRFDGLGLFALVSGLYVAAGLWATRGTVDAEAHVHGLLGLQHHLGAWGFALTPLLVLLRAGYTAVALDTTAVLAGWGAAFGRRLRASFLAEGAFLALFVWQAVRLRAGLPTDPVPLSLAAAFGDAGPHWLHAPLQLVSAFDALYALLLGAALATLEGRPVGRALGIALFAYGIALGLLIAVITFLSLG